MIDRSGTDRGESTHDRDPGFPFLEGEARSQAVGAMYAADVLGLDAVDTEGLSARATRLAEGTWQHRIELDAAISGAATTWRIERMPAVDRTILRLAVFELRYTEQPRGVVISEAIELAKRFSTARSGSFVNGILSTIAERGSGDGGM
jgi:transcription antitermination protein NusB